MLDLKSVVGTRCVLKTIILNCKIYAKYNQHHIKTPELFLFVSKTVVFAGVRLMKTEKKTVYLEDQEEDAGD